MDHFESLLQSIIDEPENFGPRLVFADWLEEQQSSQAQYIRICNEIASLQAGAERNTLEQRANACVESDQHRWNAPIHRMLSQTSVRKKARGGEIRRWCYSDGCIEHVEISVNALEAHWSTIQRIGPINSLQLVGKRNKRDLRILNCLSNKPDSFFRIKTLDLRSIFCPRERWRELFQNDALKSLTHLKLGQWSLEDRPFGPGIRYPTDWYQSNWRSLAQSLFHLAPAKLETVQLQACIGPGWGAIPIAFHRNLETGIIEVKYAQRFSAGVNR